MNIIEIIKESYEFEKLISILKKFELDQYDIMLSRHNKYLYVLFMNIPVESESINDKNIDLIIHLCIEDNFIDVDFSYTILQDDEILETNENIINNIAELFQEYNIKLNFIKADNELTKYKRDVFRSLNKVVDDSLNTLF